MESNFFSSGGFYFNAYMGNLLLNKKSIYLSIDAFDNILRKTSPLVPLRHAKVFPQGGKSFYPSLEASSLSGFGSNTLRDNFHFFVFGSLPITLKRSTSPSLHTSSQLFKRLLSNSEIWINPSVPGRISTNTP